MNFLIGLLEIIFIGLNVFTFFLFGIDKIKAIRISHRISEEQLLKFCMRGGSLGGYIGMLVFHHKTKKPSFQKRFYMILALHALLVLGFVLALSFL